MGKERVYLFMDQLRVHLGKDCLPLYPKLDFDPIWNVKNSPDFNPIETIFAHVKRWYKAERLQMIANNEEFDAKKMITKAFKRVKMEEI